MAIANTILIYRLCVAVVVVNRISYVSSASDSTVRSDVEDYDRDRVVFVVEIFTWGMQTQYGHPGKLGRQRRGNEGMHPLFVSEKTTCCPRQLFVILEFSSTAMSLCGPMCRVRCLDVSLSYDSSAASDAQCPILCSIRWSCRWLCHVSTTATQNSQDFLRLSSV